VSHHILVALDGSRDSAQALQQAIQLAQDEHARLTLITVVDNGSWTAYNARGVGSDKLAAGSLVEALTVLNRASDRVPPSIDVTTVVSYPPIRQALIRQINDSPPDLVVMGSRGRGNARAGELGSVSSYVLHHSAAPVLIAKAEVGPAESVTFSPRQPRRLGIAGMTTRFGTHIRPVVMAGQELRRIDGERSTMPTRRWQISHEPAPIERITGGEDEHRQQS
jgi:nucleotide-binding universal stress UspA family protein